LDDDAAPAATRAGGAPPAYTMLLNPDTEVPPGALATLVAALDADPALGAVGPRLRYADGALQPSRYRDPTPLTCLCDSTPLAWHWPNNPVVRRYHLADVPDDRAQDVDWLNGAALVVRSDALRAVGGLDEGFFMYSEEADLCRRLRSLGRRVRFEPAAEIVHLEGRSSGQVVAARHVHFQRSRVRYCRKHDGRAAAALVRFGLRAEFASEWLLEALKWTIGHKRAIRASRMRAYLTVIRSI
ncbi:MAG: glycosyltransferase family 2 protein, partial [Ardenticatenales bacterium]